MSDLVITVHALKSCASDQEYEDESLTAPSLGRQQTSRDKGCGLVRVTGGLGNRKSQIGRASHPAELDLWAQ